MDIPTTVTIVSVVLAVATFFLGRQSATHAAGKEAGTLKTDIRYIKDSIDRIERRLGDDVSRLESRIDQINKDTGLIRQELISIGKEAKSAHRRLDEHLQRDHNQAQRG